MREKMKLWKKLCVLKKQELIILFSVQSAGFLIGMIFTFISANAGVTIPLGFIIGIGVVFCCVYFAGMSFFAQDFNLALKMGETRKEFLFPYLLFTAGELACCCLYNILLIQIETAVIWIAGLGKAGGIKGLEFYGVSLLFVYFMLIIYAVSIEAVFGALFVKFGKKAFWALWCIWMFVCIGGSRIAEWSAHHQESLFYKIGSSLFSGITRNEPGTYLRGILFLAAAIGISWILLRKEAVNQ